MTLREHFTRNGIDGCLTPEKEEKLIALSAYLTEYNKKVNLTAITDEDGIYAKHITDCALILPFIRDGASVLDVGCGGGFPSLPVAILRDDVTVSAMDSTAKKLAFVSYAAEKMGLSNISVICGRAEELCVPPLRGSFDVVTARAVSSLPVLLELCLPYVKKGGIFAAMKSDASELDASSYASSVLGAKPGTAHPMKLVCADCEAERCVITFEKSRPTPAGYPRRYTQIKSGPLCNERS